MAGKLEGKVAWVSGSTKGIGEGVVRLFAKEGAAVTITGRGEQAGKALEKEILEKRGQGAFYTLRCHRLCSAQNVH